MLAEGLHYLLTPCSRAARRRGHLAAAISLWSRAGRCAAAWTPHYAQCHAAVARAMEGLPRYKLAVVLGSGLVRDVPLDALAAVFETVVLADIVHLWAVRCRTFFRRNVHLVSLDVTGDDPLAPWREEADLVISANVLSQLPLFQEQPGAVARHLEALRGCRGRVCLLTDTERVRRSRAGEILERTDLLEGVTLPPAPFAWEWLLAPFGEAEREVETVHRVRAYSDF